jgi:GH24 family phage-related lysozyme (muramidase)
MGLISKQCVDFIKDFEGFEPTIKNDIVNVPTLGYGMTGKEIQGLKHITEEQASIMLEKLLNDNYALPIKKNLDANRFVLNQNEFDALVSMAYNIGVSGLFGSTLYKNVLKGIKDKSTITANFQAWSNAGGKRVEGLYRRRTEEAKMFLKPTDVKPTKVDYCKEFQIFFNKVTQTGSPLTLDGYGTKTEQAYQKLGKLIRGEK